MVQSTNRVWAELVSGGDPEYASRLRYSYLNAFSKLQAPKPDKKLPKTVKEAKAILKAVKSDNQICVCKDSLNGLKLLGHVCGIMQDFKTYGLEYVIAGAFSIRMRKKKNNLFLSSQASMLWLRCSCNLSVVRNQLNFRLGMRRSRRRACLQPSATRIRARTCSISAMMFAAIRKNAWMFSCS